MNFRLLAFRSPGLALTLSVAALTARADTPPPVTVQIDVAPGLKYDPARFAVAPGAPVTVHFHNGDPMIHNLVIARPGERLKVVTAALALGSDGPARNFVPALPEVLWSTPALNPNESATLRFTAPTRAGVYPYFCTFPGHGFVMFGAMYVTRDPLPPLAADRNIPPEAAAADGPTGPGDGLIVVQDRPAVSRTFLPDCGPAAIAVGLPGGQSYCFDAGLCQLRYAWRGGFVDNTDQWDSRGDLWGKVVGRIYYRAPAGPALRLGRPDRAPAVRWRGYRLARGYPEFDFELDGRRVHELIRSRPGGGGLQLTYAVAPADLPVYLATDPSGGAFVTATAGHWQGRILVLSPSESAHFTVTLTERPGVEPLRYWSMNDALWRSVNIDPEPGVVGRAFTPGGLEKKPRTLWAGVKLSELQNGASLIAWVKLKRRPPEGGPPPVFSAGGSVLVSPPRPDDGWHHLAALYPTRGGAGRLYVDGAEQSNVLAPLPDSPAELEIGSVHGVYLAGLLDEVRIYDRILPPAEIAALYRREAAIGKLLPP